VERERDFDPEALDPMVSAVVEVHDDVPSEGASVENPIDVVSEAAAMLAGVDLGLDVAPVPAQPTGTTVPDQENAGQGNAIATVKRYFEKARFDIHAPIGMTFSIAARRSFFEQFFGTRLLVDEDRFFAPVTTADGGDQLPVERLPDEIRDLVLRISLPPPPELPEGVNF
jgi:hypothetical protein